MLGRVVSRPGPLTFVQKDAPPWMKVTHANLFKILPLFIMLYYFHLTRYLSLQDLEKIGLSTLPETPVPIVLGRQDVAPGAVHIRALT